MKNPGQNSKKGSYCTILSFLKGFLTYCTIRTFLKGSYCTISSFLRGIKNILQ